jgi:hypothetical protein
MTGWVVSTATLDIGRPEVRLFAVAEDDPANAIDLVRQTTSGSDDLNVRIVSTLSDDVIAKLGLKRGEAVEMT